MSNSTGLLRGKGYSLGKHANRYPVGDRTLLRVLADRADEHPQKPWLIFDGVDTLTYGDAWALTNHVANAITNSVGEGAHVGIFMLNQPEFLPTFFGAMVNRGLAVPINAQARGPLLHYVVEFSDVEVIVARADVLDRLAALDDLGRTQLVVVVGDGDVPTQIHDATVVRWDEWLESAKDTVRDGFPDYRDPCLIQFTSGTTGRPKGAVYPHQFLYLYPAMYTDSIGITKNDVCSTPLPLYHVAALHLIANTALHAGATALLKSRFSASRYWEEAAADGATFSIILGPMAAIIMKTCESAPEHRLDRIFCVPPPPELDEFERRYRTKILWHGFGQTEVSPLGMRPYTIDGASLDTLGYPVSWMDFGVVDEKDEMLQPGEIGEIVFRPLRPYSMFMGYYRNPDATVEALRNFMFHTGDLGYYDEEGLLHYKGRKAERIRHRGENVSALELEFIALRHPDVVECAAYGVPSEFGEEDVKLDVIVTNDLSLDELWKWLAENAPKYMVPRFMERRVSFPKTPSERVEKYILKDLALNRSEVIDFATDR